MGSPLPYDLVREDEHRVGGGCVLQDVQSKLMLYLLGVYCSDVLDTKLAECHGVACHVHHLLLNGFNVEEGEPLELLALAHICRLLLLYHQINVNIQASLLEVVEVLDLVVRVVEQHAWAKRISLLRLEIQLVLVVGTNLLELDLLALHAQLSQYHIVFSKLEGLR